MHKKLDHCSVLVDDLLLTMICALESDQFHTGEKCYSKLPRPVHTAPPPKSNDIPPSAHTTFLPRLITSSHRQIGRII